MTVRERNIVKVLKAKKASVLTTARIKSAEASPFAADYYAEVEGLESAIQIIEASNLKKFAKYYGVELEDESEAKK